MVYSLRDKASRKLFASPPHETHLFRAMVFSLLLPMKLDRNTSMSFGFVVALDIYGHPRTVTL